MSRECQLQGGLVVGIGGKGYFSKVQCCLGIVLEQVRMTAFKDGIKTGQCDELGIDFTRLCRVKLGGRSFPKWCAQPS